VENRPGNQEDGRPLAFSSGAERDIGEHSGKPLIRRQEERIMNAHPMITPILIAQIIFFASAALIAFIYVGYPLLVFVMSHLFGWPVQRAEITPSVSIIIAAYNEEKDIAAKIENSLSLDYPWERLEIIVASDCSSDRTDEIVRSYSHRGVILHRQEVRYGKTMAQHRAVQVSTGDILVFSDARSSAILPIPKSDAFPGSWSMSIGRQQPSARGAVHIGVMRSS
jgi:hypothetical protein